MTSPEDRLGVKLVHAPLLVRGDDQAGGREDCRADLVELAGYVVLTGRVAKRADCGPHEQDSGRLGYPWNSKVPCKQ